MSWTMIVEITIIMMFLVMLLHSGRQQVIQDEVQITVGTLGAGVAISGQSKIDGGRLQGARIKKIKYAMTYSGKTDNEGPIVFGLAVGLTNTEIALAMNADPQGISDDTEVDRGNLKCFPLEFIPKDGIESAVSAGNVMFVEIEDWPFKEIPEGTTLQWFIFSDTALTSGMIVDVRAVEVTDWLRD